MTLISLSDVKMEFDAIKIFDKVSFALSNGDKLALIGRNGCGKSTLLKIISGELEPSFGNVHKPKNINIAYLEQISINDKSTTILDFALLSFQELIAQENKLRSMEQKMETIDHQSAEFKKLLNDYQSLSEDFEEKGGHMYMSKTIGILNGLGFSENDRQRTAESLSGGEMVRLKLAKLLIDEPDLLLLDEPTNHLDINTTQWLENFLIQYKKSVIIVSHDRYFLDKVSTKTLELTKSRSYLFDGSYTDFKAKKESLINAEIVAYQKNQAERKRQEEIIRRFKSHGTELLAKRAKSREKMLEKMEDLEMPDISQSTMKLNLTANRQSAREVLKASNISKKFGDKQILSGLKLEVYRGEKVGIIGKNGCGKSTLLKILINQISDFEGQLNWGQFIDMVYYDQKLQGLNEKNTIIEEIRDFRPKMNDTEIRTLLGGFLFTNDETFKPITALSGGERARVVLCKLFLENANLLILDEATNHLDLYAKESLETALKDYNGTIIMVSHDRYFLENVATRIVEIEDGKAVSYNGSYSYYLEKKSELANNNVTSEKDKSKESKINDYKAKKEEEREKRKRENKIKKLEQTLEELETELEKIETELYDPAVYSDHEKFSEKNNIKKELEDKYAEVFETLENLI